MEQTRLAQLSHLVEFFGLVLGPDYEVVLHDLTLEQPCVVAIANGQISGRTIGAPLTNVAMQLIKDEVYLREDWKANYQGISANGRILRCSTFFLKDEAGRLQGLLCINFDDSRYRELSTKIYSLCHPDEFIRRTNSFFSYVDKASRPVSGGNGSAIAKEKQDGSGNLPAPAGSALADETRKYGSGNAAAGGISPREDESEQFYASIESAVNAALRSVLHGKNVPPAHLSRQEKVEVVRMLNRKGIFMLKGAIPIISRELSCSQATVYRYISQAKGREENAGLADT